MKRVPSSVMSRANVLSVLSFGGDNSSGADSYTAFKAAVEASVDGMGSRYAYPKMIWIEPGESTPGQYYLSNTVEGKSATPSSSTYSDWRAGVQFFCSDTDTEIRIHSSATGFDDPNVQIKPLFKWGSEQDYHNPTGGGNRAFRQYFSGGRFFLGENPGAVAFDFQSSNRGAITDVVIECEQAIAAISNSRGDNGPCIIANCQIFGGAVGLYQAGSTYLLSIRDCIFEGQAEAAIEVQDATLAVERITSFNNVPVILATGGSGFVSICESVFQNSLGQSNGINAIDCGGRLEAFNIDVSGYSQPVSNRSVTVSESDLPIFDGFRRLERFTTYENLALFPSTPQSIPPQVFPDGWSANESDWAVYGDYGGTGTLAQLQATIDAGREFVCLPCGQYEIDGDLHIRDITKIHGFESLIYAASETEPTVYIDSPGADNFTVIEHINFSGCKVVNRSTGDVHLKHCDLGEGYTNTSAATGRSFFTDIIGHTLRVSDGHQAYGSQINCEFQDLHIECIDSTIRIHGFKTETGGSDTEAQVNFKATNSRFQLTGGSTYALGNGQNLTNPQTPSFDLINSTGILSWNCFSPSFTHAVQVRDTQNGETRELAIGQVSEANCTNYSSQGKKDMQLLAYTSAPFATSGTQLVSSNPPAYNSLSGASFSAGYNPNGYSLNGSNGELTVTGVDLGGKYLATVAAAFRVNSGSIIQVAQAVNVVYGSTNFSVACGRDAAPGALVGLGEDDALITIPPGTTSFTIKPVFYSTTNPSYTALVLSECRTKLIYVGS